MLQNTPKHRFRSIGDSWVCSCEHILRKFGTPKQCIRPRKTQFATFFIQIVAKCSKTLPNIALGLLETIGCVRANIFYRSSVPRNSAFAPKHPFCNFFHANGSEMLENTPKTSCEVYWRQLGVSVRTYFTEARYPETVHSAPNIRFATCFMQTVAKCSKTLPNIV